MEFGVPLLLGNKKEYLEVAGYKQIPNHCEAKLEVDEQWISNVDNFGNSHFPRFHIIRMGKDWFIHRDFHSTQEGHKTSTKKSPETLLEIKRLKRIYAITRKTAN